MVKPWLTHGYNPWWLADLPFWESPQHFKATLKVPRVIESPTSLSLPCCKPVINHPQWSFLGTTLHHGIPARLFITLMGWDGLMGCFWSAKYRDHLLRCQFLASGSHLFSADIPSGSCGMWNTHAQVSVPGLTQNGTNLPSWKLRGCHETKETHGGVWMSLERHTENSCHFSINEQWQLAWQ